MPQHPNSAHLFADAQRVIPGGVNSPVRAFMSVGGEPLFMERGEGPFIFDVDGNRYIDHVMSWGPLIFGHAPARIVQAVTEAAALGTSFGASTEREVLLAEKIIQAVPSVEKMRLVNSGTEAVMTAVRLARGFTQRDKIIKFEGCYHGHSDAFLAKAGSGLATLGLPDSAGVPPGVTRDTITVPYNDSQQLGDALAANKGEIACIVMEPVAGNMGVVPPLPGYLENVRALATQAGALLIFDEVITGFRLGYGGAQALFGVTPDLTTLGKIVGGGLPLAAVGGRAEIMDMLAPVGPVYQAGTLSGNPLAVAAGLAQLEMLDEQQESLYPTLDARTTQLAQSARESAERHAVPLMVNQIGSMLTLFFNDCPVFDYATAKTSDTVRYAGFFRKLLNNGVYLAPSQFEAAFISAEHTDEILEKTAAAVAEALHGLA